MRYSKQRNVVLEVLRSTDTHPTAEWVYERACEKLPGIGIATVYRNLHALVDMGEAIVITSSGNIEHFDGTAEDHMHMQCDCCQRIMDLKPRDAAWEQGFGEMVLGLFDLDGASLHPGKTLLTGTCRTCREARKQKKN